MKTTSIPVVIFLLLHFFLLNDSFVLGDEVSSLDSEQNQGQTDPTGRDSGALRGTRANPLYVPSTTVAVRVDGVLDDVAWDRALVVPLPYEVRPGENIPAPVKTECLLTYDADNLYIAFRAYDPEPDLIRAWFKDRDTVLGDDCVGVTIDTFDDERRAYDFFSSPLGLQFDAIDHPNGTDVSWDAIWDSAGKIYDWGYAVEMSIPFNQIRFQKTGGKPQIWGLDCDRRWPRNYTTVLGAFPRDRNTLCYLCQTIKIEGFENVNPGLNVEITPTLTGIRTEEREDFPDGDFSTRDEDVEAGITFQWGLTSNMTLMGTINPDFSQVEADNLQLDINEPFALYFEEKRPFFIEGRDYFNTPVTSVYTRTIHDPDWGVKLTGKQGNSTFGFYLVQDETLNLVLPGSQISYGDSFDIETTAGVFRYKYDLGENNTLGLMLTDREGDDYFNRVYGIDGVFRLSQSDQIDVVALGSMTKYNDEIAACFETDTETIDDMSLYLSYRHFSRNWNWWASYEDFGEDFRADLGFIPQVDYRDVNAGLNYVFLAPPNHWWWQVSTGFEGTYIENQDGDSLSERAAFFINSNATLQSALNLRVEHANESYMGTEYELNYGQLYFETRPISILRLYGTGRAGDRIDYANNQPGSRIYADGGFELRMGRHVSLESNHTFERMNVDAGRLYTANITRGKFVIQFNSRMFIRAIAQYVDYNRVPENYSYTVDENFTYLFSQFLFSYKINPRTVLFVGYSDNSYGSEDYDLTQADRTIFAKIGYAWIL